MLSVSISIVIYKEKLEQIDNIINLYSSLNVIKKIYIIDNSFDKKDHFKKFDKVDYIFNNKNLGYGKAHNIGILRSNKNYDLHIVSNSDLLFNTNELSNYLNSLNFRENILLYGPKIKYPDGRIYNSAKSNYPSPLDMLLRKSFNREYLSKKKILNNKQINQEIFVKSISGCFIVINNKISKIPTLFDERFFMYNEDLDLCRTADKDYKICFSPSFHIVHVHEKGHSKSIKLLLYSVVSMIKYFNKWGWIIF